VDFANAERFRNGLMIALLAARPLRPRSLASLRRGHNLLLSGDHCQIALGPADLKTRGTFDVVWPARLFDALQKYLAVYRPRLLNGAVADSLWMTNDGSVLKQSSMQRLIARATGIYPYLFRDCVLPRLPSTILITLRWSPPCLVIPAYGLANATISTPRAFAPVESTRQL